MGSGSFVKVLSIVEKTLCACEVEGLTERLLNAFEEICPGREKTENHIKTFHL